MLTTEQAAPYVEKHRPCMGGAFTGFFAFLQHDERDASGQASGNFIVETGMRHLTVNWVAAFLQRHPYAKVLDVSAAHEHEAGLFPHGHHEPWLTSDPNPEFLAHTLMHLDFDDYVLVICRFGNRSHDAATLLESTGFRHVYNVLGGYEDLLDAWGPDADSRASDFPFVDLPDDKPDCA